MARRCGARGAAGALLILAMAGCYRNVPVAVETVYPDEQVRIAVSERGASQLDEAIGVPEREVNARVKSLRPESVSLLVRSGDRIGPRPQVLYQELVFARGDILGVHRRELDRFRTTAVAAGGAAIIAAALLGLLGGESGSSPPMDGGDSAESRVPLGFRTW